jgi:hypothetical protein
MFGRLITLILALAIIGQNFVGGTALACNSDNSPNKINFIHQESTHTNHCSCMASKTMDDMPCCRKTSPPLSNDGLDRCVVSGCGHQTGNFPGPQPKTISIKTPQLVALVGWENSSLPSVINSRNTVTNNFFNDTSPPILYLLNATFLI